MANKPLVSVIVPVYNGERFLRETIDSILQQTYSNLEVIIIDDASTDHSREIIDSYQDDRIIKIYNEKNENVCASSNKGFDIAKGKYCALIGHDDIWYLDKIEKQIIYMETHKECGVCFTKCDVIDHDGNFINDSHPLYKLFDSFSSENQYSDLRNLLMNGNKLCAPSAVIRTDVLRGVGYYDYALVQLQDYELWLRILTQYGIHILEEQLLGYRQILDTSTNLSARDAKTKARTERETLYLRDKIVYLMSDECFIATMSPVLIDANVTTKEEIECERMLLLKRISNPHWNKRCMELLNKESTRVILRNKYGYNLNQFYQDNAEDSNVKYIKEPVQKIKAKNFIEYLQVYLSAGEIEMSKKFFDDMKSKSEVDSNVATLDILYKIYDLEKEMQEESFFSGKDTVEELVGYYEALKFLLRRFEFLKGVGAREFVEYVVENKMSSSAIILAVEFGIVDKKAVLNEAAMALFNNNQRMLAVRLLDCAYRSFNDDLTKYNLVIVLWSCGNKKVAKQVLEEIEVVDEKVAELKARLKGV